MLLNNLYTIQTADHTENTIKATIFLNREHPVFKGHFPQTPVLPGVCQIQLCTELFNAVLEKKYALEKVLSVKFLSFINPEENATLEVQLDFSATESGFSLSATIQKNDVIFLKLKGTLKTA